MWGKNIIQLLKALDLLSRSQGTTRKELVQALQISDRSVSRMITAIEELGFPLYSNREPFEKEKRWHLEPSFVQKLPNITLPSLSLTFSEIISLCMLKGEAVVFTNTDIDRHVSSAIVKLMQCIPEKTRTKLATLKRIFISKTIGSKTYAGKEPQIRTLTESILNRTACKITYHVYYKDEIKDEDIGPLHFYEHNGGLYLFALKLSSGTIRSYAVERIKRIKPLTKTVDYPHDFNPEKTLNSAFNLTHGDPVTVKLWFSKNEARYIKEKPWSETQHIDDNPDGSVILNMTTSGYRDVKCWVMSFGKEARVLEPEGMRREILEEMREILCGG